MSQLSRRSLISRTAAIAAAGTATVIPLSAVALPDPAPALTNVEAPAPVEALESTPIAKLWKKRQAVRTKYEAAVRKVYELERAVLDRAGKPDPSIRYSKENEALGLTWPGARKQRPDRIFGSYIMPYEIQREIGKLSPTLEQMRLLRGRPFPLTKARRAKQARLVELLKVSRRHDRKLERLGRAMGLDDAMKEKTDALCTEQVRLEHRIMDMRCATPSDLSIKLAIYDHYADDPHIHAEDIIPELRRYYEQHKVA
jgi:hypothetical protein